MNWELVVLIIISVQIFYLTAVGKMVNRNLVELHKTQKTTYILFDRIERRAAKK